MSFFFSPKYAYQKISFSESPKHSHKKASLPEPLNCGICFENFNPESKDNIPYVIPCGHSFCYTCLDRTSQSGKKCVLCKKSYQSFQKNFQMVEALDFLNGNIKNAWETIEKMESRLEEMTEYHRKESLKSIQEATIHLENKLQTTQQGNNILVEMLGEIKKDNESLKDQLTTEREVCNSLNEKIKKITTQKNKIKTKNKQLEEQLNKDCNKCASFKEITIENERVQSENLKLHETIQYLETELKENQTIQKRQSKHYEERERVQLENLHERIRNLETELKENQMIQKRQSECYVEFEKVQSENIQLHQHIQQLETELKKYRQENQKIKFENIQLQNTVQDLKKELEEIKMSGRNTNYQMDHERDEWDTNYQMDYERVNSKDERFQNLIQELKQWYVGYSKERQNEQPYNRAEYEYITSRNDKPQSLVQTYRDVYPSPTYRDVYPSPTRPSVALLPTCYICRHKFMCPCVSETSQMTTKKTCALQKERVYPQSMMHPISKNIIHICSVNCGNYLAYINQDNGKNNILSHMYIFKEWINTADGSRFVKCVIEKYFINEIDLHLMNEIGLYTALNTIQNFKWPPKYEESFSNFFINKIYATV
jgi:hypothetical protein